MMNKQQFKRLTLVMFIPLILLGFWITAKEVVFKRNYYVSCNEYDTHFLCVGIDATNEEKNRYFRNGGVFVGNSARLRDGFNHPITTLGRSRIENTGGEYRETIVGGGVSRNLYVHHNAGLNFSGNGPCRLVRWKDESKWSMHCVKGESLTFKFQNPETQNKFRRMLLDIEIEESRLKKYTIIRSIFSVLTPFLIYALLSLVLLILVRLFRYVLYGKNNNI